MNRLKSKKVWMSRLSRLALMGVIPLGLVLLVTAGTVRETVMPPPVDNLQMMLERVDGATTVISRRLAPSTVDPEWEAVAANEAVAVPAVAVEPELPDTFVTLESGESVRQRVEKLKLEGIAYSPENPIAFVSRKTLALDGEIDGLRVAFIGPDSVMFKDERGHTHDLRLRSFSNTLQARND